MERLVRVFGPVVVQLSVYLTIYDPNEMDCAIPDIADCRTPAQADLL